MPTQIEFDRYFIELLCQYTELKVIEGDVILCRGIGLFRFHNERFMFSRDVELLIRIKFYDLCLNDIKHLMQNVVFNLLGLRNITIE